MLHYYWYAAFLAGTIVRAAQAPASNEGLFQRHEEVLDPIASYADTDHHIREHIKLKDMFMEVKMSTLDFVAMTVNHTLDAFGGETLKTLQSNAALQTQLNVLVGSVKVTLNKLEAIHADAVSPVTTVSESLAGKLVRRQSRTTDSLDHINKTATSSNTSTSETNRQVSSDDIKNRADITTSYDSSHADLNAQGLQRAMLFIEATLQHSLNMIGGDIHSANKELLNHLREQLHSFTDSIHMQILDISFKISDIMHKDGALVGLGVAISVVLFVVLKYLLRLAIELRLVFAYSFIVLVILELLFATKRE